MKQKFQIQVDNSFIDICLSTIKERTDENYNNFLSHPAALKIHAHAVRFENTEDQIEGFWNHIVDRSFNQTTKSRINSALKFMDTNERILSSCLEDVSEYLPSDLQIQCKLYPMVGYDIGIVSEGAAFLNIAHPHFDKNPCELIFMAMHEVHHVGYVHYNPIFAVSDLARLSNLLAAVRYSTHLEGLAVYSPLKRRMGEGCLFHEDYSALLNENIAKKRMTQYFDLVKMLESEPDRDVRENDFSIFEPMSASGKRLWYVTGAYMAKEIDEKLGRHALLETVKQGPDHFFALYESIS